MPENEASRILIVDDHPVVRRGLRQLIDGQSDFRVAGEAANAGDTLALCAEAPPDLVLLDLALEGSTNGIDLTKQLQAHYPDLPVLIMSMHEETIYAERALTAGARGYVMKRTPDEEVIEAIGRVLDGRLAVSDKIRERLFPLETGPASTDGPAPTDRLTDRELEVFVLIGKGHEPRHIDERLSVSVKTVNTHRRHLKQKLHLDDATELRRYAIAWHKERDVRQ
jgi:DNA-binding NarL/FixJ family response regulator